VTRIRTNLLHSIAPDQVEYLPDRVLTIDGEQIAAISHPKPGDDALDHTGLVCTPGMIDAHVHLSQFRAIGKYEPDLMRWLEKHIFPEEMRANQPDVAQDIAEAFFEALLDAGTTTAAIYTAPATVSAEIAFQIAHRIGIRAFIGKTMMDVAAPAGLVEDSETSLRESANLCRNWHRRTSLLEYVFTPRFAPVCSPRLMKDVSRLAADTDALIQTHLSENRGEVEWVEKTYGTSYVEVYRQHGLVGPRTLFGHCIHLSDDEITILRQSVAKIVHCPDSNFFLNSGTFPWARMDGLTIALGTDVGAGTSLSLPNTMKMAIYRQDVDRPSPERVFHWATRGGAAVLRRADRIGGLEIEKDADLTFWKPAAGIPQSASEATAGLVFANWAAAHVYVAGRQLR
jgi:guanine deaminase